jgi:hypothetical protein
MFSATAAALALGLTLCSATQSLAADRYAVVSIANETNAVITLLYRWGNQAEQKHTFRPKDQHWFAFPYAKPDDDHSPDFFVKFDADTAPTKYEENKRLHGFRAPDQSYDRGHKYAFRYDGATKKYIEIYDLSH